MPGLEKAPGATGITQTACAPSTQTVFYIMAGVMAATFVVSARSLPRGRVAPVQDSEPEPNLTVPAMLK